MCSKVTKISKEFYRRDLSVSDFEKLFIVDKGLISVFCDKLIARILNDYYYILSNIKKICLIISNNDSLDIQSALHELKFELDSRIDYVLYCITFVNFKKDSLVRKYNK